MKHTSVLARAKVEKEESKVFISKDIKYHEQIGEGKKKEEKKMGEKRRKQQEKKEEEKKVGQRNKKKRLNKRGKPNKITP